MSTKPPFLFAADLDGTLLPNTGKPPAPGCLERTRNLLQDLREWGVPVCFVTGRYLALARKGHGLFRLPPPTWWICNVGTEIYDEACKPNPDWESLLGAALDRSALRRALAGIPRLTEQESCKHGRHKFSLYYPEPASPALQATVLGSVGGARQGLRLIASVEQSTGRALLDIVPANSGKRHAVEYIACRYGLPAERVFFAGDSGNDLDILLSGVCGVLVGNTPDEVRAETLEMAQRAPATQIYFAEANYGDGVIEGLRHYGFWSSRR